MHHTERWGRGESFIESFITPRCLECYPPLYYSALDRCGGLLNRACVDCNVLICGNDVLWVYLDGWKVRENLRSL